MFRLSSDSGIGLDRCIDLYTCDTYILCTGYTSSWWWSFITFISSFIVKYWVPVSEFSRNLAMIWYRFMIYGWILLNKRGFTKFTILFWIFTLTTNLFGTILFLVENYGIEDDASSHLELPLLSRPSKLCFPERRAWRLQCLDTPTCNYLNRRTIYCWCILI